MRTNRRLRHALCIALPIALIPGLAFAQKTPPKSSTSTQSTAEKIAEARKRYELGLKLYEDGNYEAARIEFERALELAPSYRILYNVGLAYKQLNNYVDALRSFEQYLEQGGTEIPPERRADVEKEIAELRPRIAKVTVTTNVPGAEISLDDVVVGKAPLSAPVLVNPGVRKFSARAAEHLPSTRTITVGSSESPTVNLELTELPKYTEKKANPFTIPTIIGWSATGAAAIATGVFGVLAIGARDDQESLLAAPPPASRTPQQQQAELQDARDKTTTLSTVTDVLGITTLVFGGVSVYFTLRMLGHQPEETTTTLKVNAKAAPPKPSFDMKASPTGVMAVGTF